MGGFLWEVSKSGKLGGQTVFGFRETLKHVSIIKLRVELQFNSSNLKKPKQKFLYMARETIQTSSLGNSLACGHTWYMH